jgi:GNAT superfamily N-acetyltransferase
MNIFQADKSYADIDKLATLFFEYYQYLNAIGVPMKLAENGGQLWVETIKKSIGKTSMLVVAENKGIVSGFGQGLIKLGPDYLGNLKLGVVAHFYLDEKLRGGDAAKKMFEEMKKWFREKNVHSIELQVASKNEAGTRFWKKMGFETELEQMRLIV